MLVYHNIFFISIIFLLLLLVTEHITSYFPDHELYQLFQTSAILARLFVKTCSYTFCHLSTKMSTEENSPARLTNILIVLFLDYSIKFNVEIIFSFRPYFCFLKSKYIGYYCMIVCIMIWK